MSDNYFLTEIKKHALTGEDTTWREDRSPDKGSYKLINGKYEWIEKENKRECPGKRLDSKNKSKGLTTLMGGICK